jgi:hypothetical protein
VIVEAFSHWELSGVSPWNLVADQEIISKQQSLARAPSHGAIIDLRDLDERWRNLIPVHGEDKIMEK